MVALIITTRISAMVTPLLMRTLPTKGSNKQRAWAKNYIHCKSTVFLFLKCHALNKLPSSYKTLTTFLSK